MSRPSWLDMPRETFDSGADIGGLFDLQPDMIDARDACGTDDMLKLIDP